MPVTADELVACLRRLELLPADDWRAHSRPVVRRQAATQAAEALISELERGGKLTDYQATLLRAGKPRSWCWASASSSTSSGPAGWESCTKPNTGT